MWLHKNFICFWIHQHQGSHLIIRKLYKSDSMAQQQIAAIWWKHSGERCFHCCYLTSVPAISKLLGWDGSCLNTRGTIKCQQSLWLTGYLCTWFLFNNTPRLRFSCFFSACRNCLMPKIWPFMCNLAFVFVTGVKLVTVIGPNCGLLTYVSPFISFSSSWGNWYYLSW